MFYINVVGGFLNGEYQVVVMAFDFNYIVMEVLDMFFIVFYNFVVYYNIVIGVESWKVFFC